jgi:hypothetical protein
MELFEIGVTQAVRELSFTTGSTTGSFTTPFTCSYNSAVLELTYATNYMILYHTNNTITDA